MVAIVDQFGRPLSREIIAEPQTARVSSLRQEFEDHPSRGLKPAKLAAILEAAEQGDLTAQNNLFEDMEEKDAHILAEMGKRKRVLTTLDWEIVAPRGADKREQMLADYANEVLRDMPDLDDLIIDLSDAIGKSYSCAEMGWQKVGKELLPDIAHRPARWFTVDRETRQELRLRTMSIGGEPLNPFGWIVHTHKAKSGSIMRGGLLRVLAWPYLFKNYSIRDLAEFLEIYGLPLRLGKYQSGASEAEKATLLRAVVNIGHAAAGIVPQGMDIEFKESAKGASDPFEAMINWCERSQSKAILGGTLTSQADGKSSTNALGNVHNEVRRDLMISDSRQLAGTLTRDLIYPLLAINKGIDSLRRCPRFVFDTQQGDDMKLFAESLPVFVDMGMRIPRDWAHSKLRIPAGSKDEPCLGDKPALAVNRHGVAALKASLQDEADPVDVLVDAAMSDWKADMEPAAQIIQTEIDRLSAAGATADEVLAALPELLKKLDETGLQDRLTAASFIGRMIGAGGS